MSTSLPWVFCGGDLAGVAETAVEAVNDGKIAAWSMHKYLQGLHGVNVRLSNDFWIYFYDCKK